ncbi:MAG: hypothetical protein ABI700_00635 [Chloroflexota bacterium]
MSESVTVLTPMTEDQARTIVAEINDGFSDIAQRIRRLYEGQGWIALGYTSWRDCVTNEFDFSQSRAYQLLDYAEVEQNLSTKVENGAPAINEAQARLLAPFEADEQREIYEQAAQTAPNGKLTAAHIEQVIEQHTGRVKPKSNVKGAGRDQCQTPPYGLVPLLPYINPSWTVWEPAAGKGRLVEALKPHVASVIASDILTGQDFMTTDPPAFDVLITNPPYGPKYEWLPRCYALGKPFALLIPGETLFAEGGASLFAQYGIEIIVCYPRIDFEMPLTGFDNNGATFPTAWFTFGFNVGSPLSFVDISAEKGAFKKALGLPEMGESA